jgi:thioredoxin reductase (NADPH)
MDKHSVIIIGSGPAGLTAALYAARANLKPLVIGGYVYGGQLMNTTKVENYPGFPEGIDGPVLMQNMLSQAQKFGAEFKFVDATGVDFTSSPKKVITPEGEFLADTVILATGATPKRLDVPGEAELYGRGVSTCATCDGALYKGREVAIVGGGDTAMEEATFLTMHASKVYLIHRRDDFRASKIMAERVKANPKIEILWNTEVKAVIGETGNLDHLRLFNNKTNEEKDLKVDGFFLAIGHEPVTKFMVGQIELNEEGYINSVDGVHTSVEGVFVAGDVQDHVYRQAVTAAGAGCRAALEVEKHLTKME